jgi:hypothetical protein
MATTKAAEHQANAEVQARIERAAPDLLAALKEALEYLDSTPFIALHGEMPAKRTRAAIAKATGKD